MDVITASVQNAVGASYSAGYTVGDIMEFNGMPYGVASIETALLVDKSQISGLTSMTLFCFNEMPDVPVGDCDSFTVNVSDLDKLCGTVIVSGITNEGYNFAYAQMRGLNIPMKMVENKSVLYVQLVTNDAITPSSGIDINISLGVSRGEDV